MSINSLQSDNNQNFTPNSFLSKMKNALFGLLMMSQIGCGGPKNTLIKVTPSTDMFGYTIDVKYVNSKGEMDSTIAVYPIHTTARIEQSFPHNINHNEFVIQNPDTLESQLPPDIAKLVKDSLLNYIRTSDEFFKNTSTAIKK